MIPDNMEFCVCVWCGERYPWGELGIDGLKAHSAECPKHPARREVEELRGQVERLTRERDYWRTIVMRRAEVEPWVDEVIRLNNRIEELENEKRSGAIVYRLAYQSKDVTEIARLRAENERLTRERDRAQAQFQDLLSVGNTEIARLRSLLKCALVPCGKCKGLGRINAGFRGPAVCEPCNGKGYVPVEVEP
jgi:FtsZ-binding cell division protein ZapB